MGDKNDSFPLKQIEKKKSLKKDFIGENCIKIKTSKMQFNNSLYLVREIQVANSEKRK